MREEIKRLVEKATKQSDIIPLGANQLPFQEGIIVKYVPPKVDTQQLTYLVILQCAYFLMEQYPECKPQALHMLKHFEVK
jgi:hypothetical protein